MILRRFIISLFFIGVIVPTLGQSIHQQLINEIQKGNPDISLVRQLVFQGASGSFIDEKGRSALHIAAINAQYEVVEILLKKGANPNIKDKDGYTPISLFMMYGLDKAIKNNYKGKENKYSKESYREAAIHVMNGSTFYSEFNQDRELRENFYAACNYLTRDKAGDLLEEIKQDYLGTLNLFVKYNANLNVKTGINKERTLLSYAAERNQTNITIALIEGGANPNYIDGSQLTALYRAIDANNYFIAEALINRGANFNHRKNDEVYSEFELAVERGNTELVKLLIDKGAHINAIINKRGVPPIAVACSEGYYELTKLLIENGVDVNTPMRDNLTPLHCACLRENNTRVIIYLIYLGADINAQQTDGTTPLHYAARAGTRQDIDLIIRKGADLDIQTKKGSTPLHLASRFGKLENVTALIDAGARINIEDVVGRTPYEVALDYRIKDVLKAKDESVINELLTDFSISRSEAEKLIGKIANINSRDNNGSTVLIRAIEQKNWEVANLIVERDVDVDLSNYRGWTALHTACYIGEFEMVKLLVGKGADMDGQTTEKYTPIDLAAENGHKQIVQYLTRHGVNDNQESDYTYKKD